jgi:dephospho-CoA kinase
MRLHDSPIPIVGLTGGIATGKSTVSKLLREKGYFVIDADQLVKDIYQTSEAKEFIRRLKPEAMKGEEINFPQLREIFFQDSLVKDSIEKFIYQRLPAQFQRQVKRAGAVKFIIYDVPLLFEKKLEDKVDKTVVVYAPRSIQVARLMDRDGHREEMARKILDHQMDIEEKKEKADFVVDNSGTKEQLAEEVLRLLRLIKF